MHTATPTRGLTPALFSLPLSARARACVQTVGVLTANTGLTAAWTIGMAAYLARTGEATLTTDRSAVERYFVVLSASFLVGGMWLVVARCVLLPLHDRTRHIDPPATARD